MPDLVQIARFLANGIIFGSILGVAAIGLTLVYGILRLSNFAHGDLVIFGGFAAVFFSVAAFPGGAALVPTALALGALLVGGAAVDLRLRRLGGGERALLAGGGGALLLGGGALSTLDLRGEATTVPELVVAALVAAVVTVALVLVLEASVWRPLRKRRAGVLSLVVASLGIALVLRNGLLLYFGGGNEFIRLPNPSAIDLLGVPVADARLFVLAVAVAVVAGVHVFLRRSRTGKAMRALADDLDLARACGIDVDRAVKHVWILTGILVAVAGVLVTIFWNNSINVNQGFYLLLPLFASVILGGIGSAYGALLGGLVVGVAMQTSALWLGGEYDLAAAFAILFVVILLRPQGILGVRT